MNANVTEWRKRPGHDMGHDIASTQARHDTASTQAMPSVEVLDVIYVILDVISLDVTFMSYPFMSYPLMSYPSAYRRGAL